MLYFTDQQIKSGLKGKRLISRWINGVIITRGFKMGEINIVLCPDSYILDLNKSSLGHNYFTDIITFNYNESDIVSGDLFISLDTVLANSNTYRQIFNPKPVCELCRVIVHGVLHLLGEDDNTPYLQKKMRSAENQSLRLLLENDDYQKISAAYFSTAKI